MVGRGDGIAHHHLYGFEGEAKFSSCNLGHRSLAPLALLDGAEVHLHFARLQQLRCGEISSSDSDRSPAGPDAYAAFPGGGGWVGFCAGAGFGVGLL